MNLELFIARRIAHNGSGNRPGVMVRIAVVAVALSVTVMILALAVIMGFKREITDRVTGFSAQVEVADLRSAGSIESVPVLRSEQLERTIRSAGEVVRLTPYAVKGGVVKMPDAILGVMLKGVDGGYEWSFFGTICSRASCPVSGIRFALRRFDLPERCPGDGACAR